MDGRSVSTATSRSADISFDQDSAGLRKLVIRGFLLTLATAGIYRFWYITDLRKYFWNHTLIDGSPAAYTGRGKELLLGILIAIAVILPVQLLIFAVGLIFVPLAPFVGVLTFPVLFILIQFALYRGRRYRARRTIWRGMRLDQSGSAPVYALIATGWGLLVLATLGLAFPFMRAALERYRIRHTRIGTSYFQSKAQGRKVFLSWIPIWLIIISPVWMLVGIAISANSCSIAIGPDLLSPQKWPTRSGLEVLDHCSMVQRVASQVLSAGVSAAILILPFMFLYYRAREIRAFSSAISLGEAKLMSSLTARNYYRPYYTYLSRCSKLGIVIVAVSAAVIFASMLTKDFIDQHIKLYIAIFIASLLCIYYIAASVFFYVQILRAGQMRMVAESLSITRAEALDAVVAAAHAADSCLSEGLADALDPQGAFEVGL